MGPFLADGVLDPVRPFGEPTACQQREQSLPRPGGLSVLLSMHLDRAASAIAASRLRFRLVAALWAALSWRSRNTTLGVAGACSCAEAGIQ